MSDASKKKRIRLSKLLQELLGQPVSIKNLTDKEIADLVEGYAVMSNGEALATKLMQLAVQGKEWAVQIVLERTEGRAVQAAKEDGSDRTTEEKLDHVTAQHLNSLAKRFVKPDEQEDRSEPENVATGPASKLLDLHKDGAGGS